LNIKQKLNPDEESVKALKFNFANENDENQSNSSKNENNQQK
jgi:hypothetical protein